MTPYRLTCDYSDHRERRHTQADYPSFGDALAALDALASEEWHSITVAALRPDEAPMRSIDGKRMLAVGAVRRGERGA